MSVQPPETVNWQVHASVLLIAVRVQPSIIAQVRTLGVKTQLPRSANLVLERFRCCTALARGVMVIDVGGVGVVEVPPCLKRP